MGSKGAEKKNIRRKRVQYKSKSGFAVEMCALCVFAMVFREGAFILNQEYIK